MGIEALGSNKAMSIFKKVDADSNGVITKEEIKGAKKKGVIGEAEIKVVDDTNKQQKKGQEKGFDSNKDMALWEYMQATGSAGSFSQFEVNYANRDYVLAKVKEDGTNLYHAADYLKRDPEIVMAAVSQNGMALEYADPSMQADPAIVLAAVQQNGAALQFAAPALRSNSKIVMAAVKEDPCAIGHADPATEGYKECALTALDGADQKNPYWLGGVDGSLRKDPDFMTAAIRKFGFWNVVNPDSDSVSEKRTPSYIDPSLWENRDFVMAMIKESPGTLYYASPDIKKDKALVMADVKTNGVNELKYADPILWGDPDLALAALTKENEIWQQEEDKITSKIASDPTRYQGWTPTNSYGGVKGVFDLFADKNFLGGTWAAAWAPLKTDRDFMASAIEISPQSVGYADKTLLKDRTFAINAIEQGNKWVFMDLDKALLKDRAVVLAIAKRNGYVLAHLPENSPFRKDKEIVLTALKQLVETAKEQRQKLGPSTMLSTDDVDLDYVDPTLRNDPDINEVIEELRSTRPQK